MVFFGDITVLMNATVCSRDSGDIVVSKRHFTHRSLDPALLRADEDFRLGLIQLSAEPIGRHTFRRYMQPVRVAEEAVVTFFRQSGLQNRGAGNPPPVSGRFPPPGAVDAPLHRRLTPRRFGSRHLPSVEGPSRRS
jgi:hypothetical protein